LQRRGALAEVGYCYPADGGGWQLIEMGHRLAREPQWPIFAAIPEWYTSQATQD
jgi:hypothetical protein